MKKQTLPGKRMGYQRCKRLLDAIVSCCALILLAPLMLLIAFLIRLQDGGPAIFAQTRVGQDGKPLRIYKFRSMKEGAEEQLSELSEPSQCQYGQEYKIDADPRVTKLGAFLRRTSLDELPQLWNIIKGDMSIVGPRPVLPDELKQNYSEQEQELFLSVPPGLTGYWQACCQPEDTYSTGRRQAMELKYACKANLLFDIWLVLITAGAVIRKARSGSGN